MKCTSESLGAVLRASHPCRLVRQALNYIERGAEWVHVATIYRFFVWLPHFAETVHFSHLFQDKLRLLLNCSIAAAYTHQGYSKQGSILLFVQDLTKLGFRKIKYATGCKNTCLSTSYVIWHVSLPIYIWLKEYFLPVLEISMSARVSN